MKGKDVVERGAAAFAGAVERMSRSGDDKATAEKELAARMATSKAKLDQAMKELQEAFAQPEVIKAVKDLMGLMPPLVKALAKLVEFFAAHPALGVAAVVGGTAAKGAIAPIAAAAAPTLAKAAWTFLKGAPGALAGGAATATPSVLGASGLAGIAAPTTVGGVAVAGGAAAVAVTAAAAAAAIGSVAYAAYQAKELMKTAAPEGGVIKGLMEAISRGGELGAKAIPTAELDARNAKAVSKNADVHEVLTRSLLKTATALDRLGSSAGAARGTTGDGTSKGPGGVTPAGPGWADKY